MPVVSRSARIETPRAQVWSVLADIGAIAEWSPAVSHSVTTSDAAGGAGASRHCDLKGPLGGTKETVTERVKGERLGIEVAGARMMRSANSSFVLTKVGPATVATMTVDYEMAGGPLGQLMAAIAGGPMLGLTMSQTLEGLRVHAEAVAPRVTLEA